MSVSVTWNPLNTSHDVRKGWPLDRDLPAPRFRPLSSLGHGTADERQLRAWRETTGRFTPTPAPDVLISPDEERRLRTTLAALPAGRRRVPALHKRSARPIVSGVRTPPGREPGTSKEVQMPVTKTGTSKAAAKKKAPAAKAKRPAANKAAAKKADTNGGAPRAPRGGRALIAQVLKDAGRPVHLKLIAERVLALDARRKKSERFYNGKTPVQTISAALTVSHNTGGPFEKTEPGVFVLRSATKAVKGRKAERPAPTPRKSDEVHPDVAASSTVVQQARPATGK